MSVTRTRRQGIFWLLTIPGLDFSTPTGLPTGTVWLRGQREVGAGGFDHWQLLVAFTAKQSLSGVKRSFGQTCHAELSRSESAAVYVWKDDTAVAGTRFEFGAKPIRLNSAVDWESVWQASRAGVLEDIPARIRVVSYRTIRAIASDFDTPQAMLRSCRVFWGPTGTGKSRRAWEEAGMDAYCKDPRSKFWCGYQIQENVILDEFRGGIDISHLLRWLDRYPCRVEIKGSSKPLRAVKYWITSNLNPDYWYPECDFETLQALKRRLEVVHMPNIILD